MEKKMKLGGVKGAAVRGPPAPHVHGQQLRRPRGALRAVNRRTSFRAQQHSSTAAFSLRIFSAAAAPRVQAVVKCRGVN